MTNYLNQVYGAPTPQSEPLPDREERMVQNSAGGYVFPVDDFTRLRRFLILGSEGGTYYAAERPLTVDNAKAVRRCLDTDGRSVVDETLRASRGAAPRIGPPLFVLAMAASFGNDDTRRYALSVLPQAARTGSHLFRFVSYADTMRGWGKGLRQAVGNWYDAQGDVKQTAYQMVKYRHRDGWTHRDLLRKAHPAGRDNPDYDALYAWVTQGTAPPADDARYDIIRGYQQAQNNAADHAAVADAIRRYRLTWEMIPAEAMNDRQVWEALFEQMPLTAMLRNLGTLTRLGIIAPMSDASRRVADRLTDERELRAARIHPIAILSALTTYRAGKGVRGQNTWTPVPAVADALDAAFGKSFAFAPQTGKRFYLGIDVSGSMEWDTIAGVAGLTPRQGAAALAMAIARRESNYYIAAFADGNPPAGYRFSVRRNYDMMPLDISATDSIADALRKTGQLPAAGTDCALPMLDAAKKQIPVDCFVVITDNETWAGDIHPCRALEQYRERTGIAAKMVVVAMTSTGFTIADPEDAGTLDVVGFDASAPQVIADFVGASDNTTPE